MFCSVHSTLFTQFDYFPRRNLQHLNDIIEQAIVCIFSLYNVYLYAYRHSRDGTIGQSTCDCVVRTAIVQQDGTMISVVNKSNFYITFRSDIPDSTTVMTATIQLCDLRGQLVLLHVRSNCMFTSQSSPDFYRAYS